MRVITPFCLSFLLVACGGSSGSKETPISASNNSPVINLASTMAVDEKQRVKLTATATDSDGTIQKISWQQSKGPQIELQAADTLTPEFIAPEVLNTQTPQTIGLTLTVTDNQQASTRQTVDIKVSPVNEAPTLNADENYAGFIGETVTINCSATDPDQDELSLTLKQISGEPLSLPGDSITCPFKVKLPAAAELELTADDKLGLTTSKKLSLQGVAFSGKELAFNSTPFDKVLKEKGTDLVQNPFDPNLAYSNHSPKLDEWLFELLDISNPENITIKESVRPPYNYYYLTGFGKIHKTANYLYFSISADDGTGSFSTLNYMPISAEAPMGKFPAFAHSDYAGTIRNYNHGLVTNGQNYLLKNTVASSDDSSTCVEINSVEKNTPPWGRSCDEGITKVAFEALDQQYIYAINEKHLNIFDHNFKQISNYLPESTPGFKSILSLEGKHLFISGEQHLFIVDISSPSAPELKSSLELPALNKLQAKKGSKLYLSDDNRKVKVLDISDIKNPVLSQEFLINHNIIGMVVLDEQILFSNGKSILLADTNSHTNFKQKNTSSTSPTYSSVYKQDFMYALSANTQNSSTLRVLDTTSWPFKPLTTMNINIQPSEFLRMSWHQNTLFVFSKDGKMIGIDTSTPSAPKLIKSYDLSPYNGYTYDAIIHDSRAFLLRKIKNFGANGFTENFAIELDISNPLQPEVLSSVNTKKFPYSFSTDYCPGTNALYAVNQQLYFRCGNITGVDISRPGAFNNLHLLDIRVERYNTPFNLSAPTQHGDYLYASLYSNSIIGIWKKTEEATNKYPYTLVGSLKLDSSIKQMTLSGNHLHLLTSKGLSLMNIENPEHPYLEQHMYLETAPDSIIAASNSEVILQTTSGLTKITDINTSLPSIEGRYHQVTLGQSLSYNVNWQSEQVPTVNCQVTEGLCEVTNNTDTQHLVTWDLKGAKAGGQQIQINVGSNLQFKTFSDKVLVQ